MPIGLYEITLTNGQTWRQKGLSTESLEAGLRGSGMDWASIVLLPWADDDAKKAIIVEAVRQGCRSRHLIMDQYRAKLAVESYSSALHDLNRLLRQLRRSGALYYNKWTGWKVFKLECRTTADCEVDLIDGTCLHCGHHFPWVTPDLND